MPASVVGPGGQAIVPPGTPKGGGAGEKTVYVPTQSWWRWIIFGVAAIGAAWIALKWTRTGNTLQRLIGSLLLVVAAVWFFGNRQAAGLYFTEAISWALSHFTAWVNAEVPTGGGHSGP